MQYNCCNPAFGIRLEIFVVHSFRCRVSCSECITIPSLSSQTNDMQFTCCTFLYQLHKNCSRLHNIEAALKVRKTKLELELEVEDSSWVKVCDPSGTEKGEGRGRLKSDGGGRFGGGPTTAGAAQVSIAAAHGS